MHSSLSNIRLAGIAVTTGSVVRDFIADGLAAGLDRVALERTAQTIGLRERRVAAPGVTALDLCADATERLDWMPRPSTPSSSSPKLLTTPSPIMLRFCMVALA